jgi:hypothetical protein
MFGLAALKARYVGELTHSSSFVSFVRQRVRSTALRWGHGQIQAILLLIGASVESELESEL